MLDIQKYQQTRLFISAIVEQLKTKPSEQINVDLNKALQDALNILSPENSLSEGIYMQNYFKELAQKSSTFNRLLNISGGIDRNSLSESLRAIVVGMLFFAAGIIENRQ